MIYSVIYSVRINHKPIDFHCKFHHLALYSKIANLSNVHGHVQRVAYRSPPPPHISRFAIFVWSCPEDRGKESTHSAICQHCSSKGHPLPKIDHFKVMDQEVSQVACGAKEAIHIPKLRFRTQQKMLAKW